MTPTAMTQALLIAGLPLPPSVNAMYRRTGRGVALTPAAARFRRDAVFIIRDARNRAGFDLPQGARLRLTLRIWQNAGDADNRLKAAQDALALALGFDDKQIAECTAVVMGRGQSAAMFLEVLL